MRDMRNIQEHKKRYRNERKSWEEKIEVKVQNRDW